MIAAKNSLIIASRKKTCEVNEFSLYARGKVVKGETIKVYQKVANKLFRWNSKNNLFLVRQYIFSHSMSFMLEHQGKNKAGFGITSMPAKESSQH